MSERTHVDLFTGLGGFSLAAQANGIRTVAMCESDAFCRGGLARAWPGIPIIENIKGADFAAFAGAWLLTAGVPCQPASRAGKQRGAGDDRWLWPEAVRVLSEVMGYRASYLAHWETASSGRSQRKSSARSSKRNLA